MQKLLIIGALATLALPIGAQAHHSGKLFTTGMASFYGKKFAGRLTANGERFNPSAMTAAHRTARFGTKIRVTNLRNGKKIVVRINDRGPYAKGRIIDLSRAAARKIGMIHSGTAKVRLERVN